MYELGIRFGISSKPVIIFRESHSDNESIFDIHGFYTHHYKVTQYHLLQEHIKKKIIDYEKDLSRYESPIIKVLKKEMSIEVEVNRRSAYALMLSMEASLVGMIRNVGGAVSEVLAKYPELSVPEQYSDNLKFFVSNLEQLKGVDWSDFYFKPYRMPALEQYLAMLPLRGLLPDEIEASITMLVFEYHNVFLSSNRIWKGVIIENIIHYVQENTVLEYVSDAVQALLNQPNEELTLEIYERIKALINSSSLVGD